MNAEEIAKLCESISLKEREGPVRTLKADLKVASIQRMKTSLVGKVLLRKTVNSEVFRSVMRKVWKTKDWVDIEHVNGNVFTFQFQNMDNKQRIISGGPFIMPPLMCMTMDISRFLRSIIGEVLEVDGSENGSAMPKFLRVRVAIEIDKPLRRFLRVDVMGDGVESIMLLKYERLPNFCFHCRFLGHTTSECPEKPIGHAVLQGEELPFRFWMRAPVIVTKQGYWGRRREGSEGGSRVNWRSMDRTVEDRGGGRVSKEFSDRQRAQPFLVGNKLGKEISSPPNGGRITDSRELTKIRNVSQNQGRSTAADFVFNSTRERKEVKANSTNPGVMDSVVVGQRELGSPAVLVGQLNKSGSTGPSESQMVGQENTDIVVGGLNGPKICVNSQSISSDPFQEPGHSGSCIPLKLQAPSFDLNPQFTVKESSFSGSWKRRARANQIGNESGLYGFSLGKNKASDGNPKESEVSKKQKSDDESSP
ncbi:hypothetical protein EZV62_026199 [Acer yangbiense]|uniref:CCHC-type domain-containing protein n=1 Tax=Acer yangbiense TaxID=1000413 RepID=A0A5C7GQT3_9ROSI|nr:hypothetical protein EZV62_026199 [Acer yangbiense]